MSTSPAKAFTGYRITAILVGCFAVVIAVNLVMARYAIGTFSGTVVDNSYVASQHYNEWLAAADRQARLGWTVAAERAADGRVVVLVRASGVTGAALAVTGVARHPLGRAPDRSLAFASRGESEWISTETVPAGRWTLSLELRSGTDKFRQIVDLQ